MTYRFQHWTSNNENNKESIDSVMKISEKLRKQQQRLQNVKRKEHPQVQDCVRQRSEDLPHRLQFARKNMGTLPQRRTMINLRDSPRGIRPISNHHTQSAGARPIVCPWHQGSEHCGSAVLGRGAPGTDGPRQSRGGGRVAAAPPRNSVAFRVCRDPRGEGRPVARGGERPDPA
jgi:hypothetical protein